MSTKVFRKNSISWKLIFSVHEIKLKDNIRVMFWKHL